jgi:integrase
VGSHQESESRRKVRRPQFGFLHLAKLVRGCGGIQRPGLYVEDFGPALRMSVPMKVVSERFGHSTMGITDGIYSHVTSELARDSAERVAAVLASG